MTATVSSSVLKSGEGSARDAPRRKEHGKLEPPSSSSAGALLRRKASRRRLDGYFLRERSHAIWGIDYRPANRQSRNNGGGARDGATSLNRPSHLAGRRQTEHIDRGGRLTSNTKVLLVDAHEPRHENPLTRCRQAFRGCPAHRNGARGEVFRTISYARRRRATPAGSDRSTPASPRSSRHQGCSR
jgi:hypothetical protein